MFVFVCRMSYVGGAGVKCLATVLVGFVKPPDNWQQRFFADCHDDEQQLNGDVVRSLLLEHCTFVSMVHSLRSNSLSAPRSATAPPSTDAARAAATAIGETAGAFAANAADHQQYESVFKKHFATLVSTTTIVLFDRHDIDQNATNHHYQSR